MAELGIGDLVVVNLKCKTTNKRMEASVPDDILKGYYFEAYPNGSEEQYIWFLRSVLLGGKIVELDSIRCDYFDSFTVDQSISRALDSHKTKILLDKYFNDRGVLNKDCDQKTKNALVSILYKRRVRVYQANVSGSYMINR